MKKTSPNLFWFLANAGKHALWLILSLMCCVFSALALLAMIYWAWQTIQAFLTLSQGSHSQEAVVRTLAWGALSAILYMVGLLASHSANFRMARNTRLKIMKRLLSLPVGFFDEHSSGKLAHLIEENIDGAHSLYAHLIPDLAYNITFFFGALVMMFAMSWRMALLTLSPLALAIPMFVWIGSYATTMRTYMDQLSAMNSAATEYVRAIAVVKTFGVEPKSFRNFIDAVDNYTTYVSHYAAQCKPPMSIYSATMVILPLIMAVAGFFILPEGDSWSLSRMFFYTLLSSSFGLSLMRLLYTSEWIGLGMMSIRNLQLFYDTEPLPNGTKEPRDGDLAFEHVTFTYPGASEPAVKDLSFVLPQGQKWALVGPSGGGKSTIAKLAARFWDPDSGRITLAGDDLRNLDHHQLMNHTALVFQNPALFKTTLADNIAGGRQNLQRSEIEAAARAAQLDDTLARLPQGLDTKLGSEGTYLSGGEAQRVALARAAAQKAPLVILDEATAFADPENEAKIQAAFAELTAESTVLMIAHRLTSVRHADRILVVDDGKVVEQGTHDQLMAQEGLYKKLYDQYTKSLDWQVSAKGGDAQ